MLVLATACGDGGAGGRAGEAGEQATPPSVDTAPDTDAAPRDTVPPGGAGPAADTAPAAAGAGAPFRTGPIERSGSGAPVAVLRAVRTAAHPGFDRVVLEFESGPPGYRVEYVDTVFRCGSGEVAAIDGAHDARIALEPAYAHTEEGAPTIVERARSPGLPALRSLVLTCDFEARVEWAAGLSTRGGFRVLELRAPPRLVIDFRN